MVRRLILAFLAATALGIVACGGGNPCEKLLKFYCEEKKDKNLCDTFTEKVNAGMSKEACESTLKSAK